MALNVLAKQCVIIGVITLLTSLMLVLSEAPTLKVLFSDGNYSQYARNYVVQHVIVMALALLASPLSALMIVGLVKKRHVFVAPWLVGAFLVSLLLSIVVVSNTLSQRFFYSTDLMLCLIVVGMAVIILYPTTEQFLQMRRENAVGSQVSLEEMPPKDRL